MVIKYHPAVRTFQTSPTSQQASFQCVFHLTLWFVVNVFVLGHQGPQFIHHGLPVFEGGGTEVGTIRRHTRVCCLPPPSSLSQNSFWFLVLVTDVLTLWHSRFETGFFQIVWVYDSRLC